MRICGRVLRPSDLQERRFLLGQLGVTALRVPRTENPYAVARRLRRLAHERGDDVMYLRSLARRTQGPPVMPPVSPAPDHSDLH